MFHSFLILILVLAIMTLVIQSFRSPFPTSTRILKKLQILASTRDTGREQGRKNYSSKPNTSASSSSSTNNKTAKASGTKNNLNVQKATKQGKEEKTKESHQIITRDITDTSERRSLGSLRVGEKLSGKIMTIVKHGFFMDVGSTKDGLVHVKDISKDYFVHNLVNKYSPGQVVDVWVKFVDAATNKLGLQMFPISEDDASKSPQSKVDNLRKSLIFFPSETSVSGTVVKVSDLGVYVDVGASVTAFLPKRKMKLTKKQMKFKPWEVHPLNSQLNALVHESDKTRNRISLTTYAVVDWEEKLPNKDFIIKNGMVEDDEELGGSTRASIANMRALQNTLQLDPDEDDDEDDDDGEDLSAAEINALTGGRHKSQLLIDETAQSNSKSDKGKKSTSSPVSSELNVLGEGQDTDDEEEEDRRVMPTGEDEMFGEEMSTEELFDELSQGRPYLTLKEIKKWDYLKDFLDNGDVDEAKLKELISESGGSGKLNVEQLDTFIDLLVENLGLTEMDEDGYDEDEEEEEDAVRDLITGGSSKKVDIEGEDLLLIDDFSVSDRPSAQLVSSSLPKATSSTTSTTTNADDTSDLDSDDMEVRLERPDPSKGFGITNKNLKKQQQASLEEMFEKKSTTNDLLQYIFVDLAGEKGHVNLNDILNWEFAQALVEQNGITRDGLIKVFDQYANPRDKKVDRNAFEKILDKLSDIDLLASPEDSTKKVIATSQQVNKEVVLPHGKVVLKTASEQSSPDLILADPIPTISRGFSAEGTMNILSEDFDFENGAGDDLLADLEFEQITVEDAFKKLADGKTFITLDPLLSWDIVSELLEDGVIDAQKVKELFNQAGAKKGKLSYEGFEQFIDLLSKFTLF